MLSVHDGSERVQVWGSSESRTPSRRGLPKLSGNTKGCNCDITCFRLPDGQIRFPAGVLQDSGFKLDQCGTLLVDDWLQDISGWDYEGPLQEKSQLVKMFCCSGSEMRNKWITESTSVLLDQDEPSTAGTRLHISGSQSGVLQGQEEELVIFSVIHQ